MDLITRKRTEASRKAIRAHLAAMGHKHGQHRGLLEEQAIDLVTDLLHQCHAAGWDRERVLRCALRHFLAESVGFVVKK